MSRRRTSSSYPSSSAASFKGKSAKLADIGRELKVATVLEGSVRKSANRVRITGRFTIHGITKTITIPVALIGNETRNNP